LKNQHIQCLEIVLDPLTRESAFNPLINPRINLQNKLNLIQEVSGPLKEFQKDFIRLKEKKIKNVLRNLSQILGYGLGSTPESDDLFLGVLTAKHCLNKDINDQFDHLTKFPFERYTTSKSAKLIRSFLTQNFPLELIPFIELLKIQLEDDQVKVQFELEIRKIRTIGSSSGYYFLLGVLWELKYNEKRITLLKKQI
jgi:hypothetical protein